MLKTPSPAALTAFVQWQETPRWRDVNEWFDEEIEAITLRLLGARETADVHELRGRLVALRDFRQTVRDARSLLARQGHQVPLA